MDTRFSRGEEVPWRGIDKWENNAGNEFKELGV
jgi:hypothetical protein